MSIYCLFLHISLIAFSVLTKSVYLADLIESKIDFAYFACFDIRHLYIFSCCTNVCMFKSQSCSKKADQGKSMRPYLPFLPKSRYYKLNFSSHFPWISPKAVMRWHGPNSRQSCRALKKPENITTRKPDQDNIMKIKDTVANQSCYTCGQRGTSPKTAHKHNNRGPHTYAVRFVCHFPKRQCYWTRRKFLSKVEMRENIPVHHSI